MTRSLVKLGRRFWWTGSIVAALVALSVIGWWRIGFTSSMEMMLPRHSEARETLDFLRDTKFASKAILWFRLSPDGTEDELFAAANREIARMDPKLIQRVIRPPRQADAMGMVTDLLRYQGDLVDTSGLDAAMRPEALKKRMRELYVQMVKPSGSFMEGVARRDPLGISNDLLGRLYALSKSLGYRADIRNGHFVHPDGRQLFLLLETTASVTDIDGSKRLVAHLEDLAKGAGPHVTITPLAGHIHTVQNDRVMQDDVQRVAMIDLIGFALVFVVFFRDWRIVTIFILPIMAITVSIGLCGMVFASLATMVVGMAATMAGSAVDYGIHVYTAVRLGHEPFADARKIARPLLTGMMATSGVFVAFMFSRVAAYRQLGAMATVALVLSAFGALFVLPALVKQGGKLLRVRGTPVRQWGRRTRGVSAMIVLLCVAAGAVAMRVRFDPNLSSLDGTDKREQAAERDFQAAWTRDGHDMAMVAAIAPTMEQAAQLNDRIECVFSKPMADANFVSLAGFWPSEERRSANRTKWRAFWTDERAALLRSRLAEAGRPYGFAADAFEPFFQGLHEAAQSVGGVGPLAFIEEQFVIKAEGRYVFLSYFDDRPECVATARRLAHDMPGVQVVSNRALGQSLTEASISESRRIVLFSVGFIVLSMLVMTRQWRRSLVMMLPAVVGVSAMLSVSVLANLPLNAASIIAGIVAFGLCIDYGVFTVDAWERDETTMGHSMTSVHLSSLTTLVGSLALLWANHPAMFLVAVTLNTGLVAGYLAAVVLVPAACSVVLPDEMAVREEAVPS